MSLFHSGSEARPRFLNKSIFKTTESTPGTGLKDSGETFIILLAVPIACITIPRGYLAFVPAGAHILKADSFWTIIMKVFRPYGTSFSRRAQISGVVILYGKLAISLFGGSSTIVE